MSSTVQTRRQHLAEDVRTETVLTNAQVVLADDVITGTVVWRDGVITDVDEGVVGCGEDCDGDYLLPGVVELHTDHLEYHFEPRPGTQWDPVPAVLAHDAQMTAAGVTTVFDAVRVGSSPGANDPAPANAHRLAEAVTHSCAAGLLRADHYIHLRCEVSAPDCLDSFESFEDDPYVRLASLMDHTPGERQYADIEAFRTYVIGKRQITDAEFDSHVATLRTTSAQYSDVHRHAISQRAHALGITLATHDDATAAHVAESVSLGVGIAEFPTTVEAARAAADAGQLVVMGAPNVVRGGSQSGNVAASELLSLGLLHVLSSDYVPASGLQAVLGLAAEGLLPIEQGVHLLSTNPARAVDLHDRGEIALGLRADVVRVHRHAAGALHVPVVRAVWREGSRVA
ncbi:MAG: alpha-D-ribose 1-methylphosphonate 5-triphosphate diphosphatase [Micrococcales bacterium]|nr:alpha-D-ribose 1-methylphosphonate 5-triphosphate diphosphatase [Micrococcales bacterium]MCL2667918.1 alpha-D-ribose 1-methylphosphonate 5-triphosphate diphosphatase [Micrococcales bacterium]